METDKELSRVKGTRRENVQAVDAVRRQPGLLTSCPKWAIVGWGVGAPESHSSEALAYLQGFLGPSVVSGAWGKMTQKWGLALLTPHPGDPLPLACLHSLSVLPTGVIVNDLTWPHSSVTSLPFHDSPLWRICQPATQGSYGGPRNLQDFVL